MRIVFLGDINDDVGLEIIEKLVPWIKERLQPDFIVVNGENSAKGLGITLKEAEKILKTGVDVITLGNHTWFRKDVKKIFEKELPVIRPVNYPDDMPGKGWIVVEKGGKKLGVINALGAETLIDIFGKEQVKVSVDPFKKVEEVLNEHYNKADIWMVDFHGESEIEKKSLAYWLDGRVHIIVGTHTHVQTADLQILPEGSVYITDAGMCGTHESVVGIKRDMAVEQYVGKLPVKMRGASSSNKRCLNGIIVEVDEKSKKIKMAKRIIVQDNPLKESEDRWIETTQNPFWLEARDKLTVGLFEAKDWASYWQVLANFFSGFFKSSQIGVYSYRKDIERFELRTGEELIDDWDEFKEELFTHIKREKDYLFDWKGYKVLLLIGEDSENDDFENNDKDEVLASLRGAVVFSVKEFTDFEKEYLDYVKRIAIKAYNKLYKQEFLIQQVKELETIFDVSKQIINSSLDLDELLGVIIAKTKDALNSEASSVLLRNEDTGELYFNIVEGGSGEKLKEIRLKRGQGIAGWVAENKESVIVPDTSKDDRFFKGADQKTQFKTRSIIAVPLITVDRATKEEKVIGVLEVLNKLGEIPYNMEDLKMVELIASLAAGMIENSKLYRQIKKMYKDTIHVLANAMDARDPYTHGHSQRVAIYSKDIAEELGWGEEEREKLEMAALLHDIGKIGIRDSILLKKGRLTDEEYREIQKHPVISAKILEPFEMFAEIIPWVKHHHERYDGRGYPDGLKGENVPIGSRIIAVADTFDAMTSHRAYRRGLPPEVAIDTILKERGSQFDPEMAEAFVRVFEKKYKDNFEEIRSQFTPQAVYENGKVIEAEKLPDIGVVDGSVAKKD